MWPVERKQTFNLFFQHSRIRPVLFAALVAAFLVDHPTRGDLTWQFTPQGIGLGAQATATDLAFPQQVTDMQTLFAPNFAVGPDIYDYGNAALAASTQSGAGWAVASSGVSVLAVTGAGTSTAQVYFRVSTIDDASSPPPPWGTDSNATLQGFFPLTRATTCSAAMNIPPQRSISLPCPKRFLMTGRARQEVST